MLFPKNKPLRDKRLLRKFWEFCKMHDIGCLKCGSPDIQIHHGIYRSQGGSDEFKNLYPLCTICHDVVHYDGKPAYEHIKKLKRLLWQLLEQRLSMDLSDHLDS